MWRGDGVCAQLVVQLCSPRAHGSTACVGFCVWRRLCARRRLARGANAAPMVVGVVERRWSMLVDKCGRWMPKRGVGHFQACA